MYTPWKMIFYGVYIRIRGGDDGTNEPFERELQRAGEKLGTGEMSSVPL